jgi:hypothetical protein
MYSIVKPLKVKSPEAVPVVAAILVTMVALPVMAGAVRVTVRVVPSSHSPIISCVLATELTMMRALQRIEPAFAVDVIVAIAVQPKSISKTLLFAVAAVIPQATISNTAPELFWKGPSFTGALLL